MLSTISTIKGLIFFQINKDKLNASNIKIGKNNNKGYLNKYLETVTKELKVKIIGMIFFLKFTKV